MERLNGPWEGMISSKGLTTHISEETGLSERTVKLVLKGLTEAVPALLTTKTNKVNVWALGTFELRMWKGRTYPKTKGVGSGLIGYHPSRYRIKFTPSKCLKDAVQFSTQCPLPSKSVHRPNSDPSGPPDKAHNSHNPA